MPDDILLTKADATMADVVTHAIDRGDRLLRVEAPPGAGKTRLIKRLVAAALARDTELVVAVQTNAQLLDLARGLADELEDGEVGIWPGTGAKTEHASELSSLARSPRIRVVGNTRGAYDPQVLVAVGAKLGHHAASKLPAMSFTRVFELGVVDEAYQMAAGGLYRFGALMKRLALVGDPGQLEPFTELDPTRWTGLEASALTPGPSAVDALCAVPSMRWQLPASLRLDARAANVVQRCFYPNLPFRAVAIEGDRGLTFAKEFGDETLDAVLDRAAETGWGLLRLPARLTVRDDPEVAAALATLARALLSREATVKAHWPPALANGAPLEPGQIAIATAHRDQRNRVRDLLADTATRDVVVDTANRLQGREFDVVLAWHPLSGRVEATEFHLDTGRLCVMASRHRQACIFVCRDGLAELLDDHLPSGLRPKGATDDREHDGWEAHRRLLEHVEPGLVEMREVR